MNESCHTCQYNLIYIYIYIHMSITCICDTPIDNELVLAECYIHVLYIYALHIMDESCHTCQYNLIYIYIYIYIYEYYMHM